MPGGGAMTGGQTPYGPNPLSTRPGESGTGYQAFMPFGGQSITPSGGQSGAGSYLPSPEMLSQLMDFGQLYSLMGQFQPPALPRKALERPKPQKKIRRRLRRPKPEVQTEQPEGLHARLGLFGRG